MSLSGDSCSTSSGCVSDLDNLSEDPSPDSPISDTTISDSLLSSTNKLLPNNDFNDEFNKELIITDTTTILSINPKVPEEVAPEIDELLEEELIESEIIVIDSSPVDCGDSSPPLTQQILTPNLCYALEYVAKDHDEDQEDEGLVRDVSAEHCFQTTFNDTFVDFDRTLNCLKAETASIKSDTSHTSGHESDSTRQSSDSPLKSTERTIQLSSSETCNRQSTDSGQQSLSDSSSRQSSSDSNRQSVDSPKQNQLNNSLRVNSRPILNGVFKELKDFKCLSTAQQKSCSDTNCSKTSTDCSGNSGSSSPCFCCKWTNCDWPGSKDDLVDHIREIHVELQPYQQQKHNWTDVCQTKSGNRNQIISKRVAAADSPPNCSQTKKVESTQQYVCLWEGCKVYGKGSSSRNWLERHVLEQHSGPRPFKCIVEGCGQRFKVQSALERHVNSHFKPTLDCTNSNCSLDVCPNGSNSCFAANCSNNNSDSNMCPNTVHGLTPFELHLRQTSVRDHSRATMSAVRCKTLASDNNNNNTSTTATTSTTHHMCTNGTPNKILKRKKSNPKLRRKCFYVKCSEDYFDECVMEQVRYGLIQLNAQTGLDISGNQSTITFHSRVIARRENDSGEVNVLLKWEPNDILPDSWVTLDKLPELKTRTVPVSTLPSGCLAQLIENTDGFERKPKIKQRRK